MNSPQINVVLVRTIYASNIGAASRAVSNMGGDRLILLDPQTDVNSKARQGAAGAQEKLQNRTVYDSWESFYRAESDGVRIAFTKRGGRLRDPRPLPDLMDQLYHSGLAALDRPLYLIFGPEDNGLSAEDISLSHYCASIPTFGSFSSINLSHAVILALFIIQSQLKSLPAGPPSKTPVSSHVHFPEETIKRWLVTLGFSLDDRKTNAYYILRKVLLSNLPNEAELSVLEAILQQNIRKLQQPKGFVESSEQSESLSQN